jgi:3-dehydroquinate synthase
LEVCPLIKKIPVDLKEHRYEVMIEPGLLVGLGRVLRELSSSESCAVLADESVFRLYGETVVSSLKESGFQVAVGTQTSGEDHKTLDTVRRLYDVLLDAKLDRLSPVMSLGGGVNGDTAGFVASTYLRGVPFVQVPTTLLSMVDASVGGKVGVNVPQGKNLIGCFYQPVTVLIDPSVLSSLPEREFRCGVAECIKHGMLGDAELFSWMENSAAAILEQEVSVLEELIRKNVAFKAKIVSADERERGIRAHLNLGHTFAHAIEKTTGYGVIKHGEAVSLGMIAACRCAMELGICGSEVYDRLVKLICAVGLPERVPLVSDESLLRAMRHDKKAVNGRIRFVLPRNIGEVGIYDQIPEKCLNAAWEEIRSRGEDV